MDLKKYFEASDLSDFEITINQGKFDVSKEGDYEITVTAMDEYKNKAEKQSTVHVLSSEEAEKEGLTKDSEGKMALSKETKAEVDSGKTTIKESEDVIDNSKPNTSNGGNSSNSGNSSNTGNTGNSGNSGNTGSNTKPEHKHNWVAQYETVHHEAQYETKWVVDQAAWDEQVPRYEMVAHDICSTCGADLTGTDIASHVYQHIIDGTDKGGHYTEWRNEIVGYDTVHHDEVGHNEQVLVKEAWDEQKLTGYICSECGTPK